MATLLIPLRVPPRLSAMQLVEHGRLRRERYRMHRIYGLHFYQYRGTLDLAGTLLPLEPGTLSVTPPGVEMVWHFPRRAPHYYVHLIFPDHVASDLVEMPVLFPPAGAARRAALVAEYERALADLRRDPARVTAWIWNLLWSLVPRAAEPAAPAAPAPLKAADEGQPFHPAIRRTLATIERGLDQPLSLGALAADAGLSREHLIRLFQRHRGASVMAWVRRRRLERARELLLGSSLPVHAIARAVGIPDLHRFNKLIRRQWNASPTALRRR